MPDASRSPRGITTSYASRLVVSVLLLGGLTLLLVLVVLPRRYVLGAGFREAGISFPTVGAPFRPGETSAHSAPVFPTVAMDGAPTPRGPRLSWERVVDLVERRRHAEAAELLAAYLGENPDDPAAAREYAVVLIRDGRLEQGIQVLRRLAADDEAHELRLLLARTLRDAGRTGEAASEYRRIWRDAPSESVALEWSRAWSWAGRYDAAAEVLGTALGRLSPGHALTVELARVHIESGSVDRARALLDRVPAESRARLGAPALPPVEAVAADEPEAVPLLERARRARAEGDTERAAALFDEVLTAEPGNADAWLAWADLLQYDRSDYTGARDALRRADSLGATTPARRYRLAQLEGWTGEYAPAEERLVGLLDRQPGPTASDAPPRSGVLSLLGDVLRWRGDRRAAHARYVAALELSPGDSATVAKLASLDAETLDLVRMRERPGASAHASSLADADDYRRLDMASSATAVRGPWVVRGEAGYRWLEGIDLTGAPGRLQGGHGTLEVARWWRLGTLRTGLRVGGDGIAGTDLVVGAEARLLRVDGSVIRASWERGPAYMALGTLQSGVADYDQELFRLEASRRIGDTWGVTADLQLARFHSDLGGMPDPTRVSLAARFNRSFGEHLSGGTMLRALSFSEPVPVVGGRRVFWDPESGVSGGGYVEFGVPTSDDSGLKGLLFVGAARLDERQLTGPAWAPQIEVEAGWEHTGRRMRTGIDLFYLQGQFRDYRSWGARLSITPGRLRDAGSTP